MAPKQEIADWQLQCGQIRERAGRILKMEQWTDCSFLVGALGANSDTVEVKTHKLILAMASPVFEAMFYGSLKEGNDPIRIPDMQPAAFKTLMEYIYTDNIDIDSYNMACDLFYGAQKYMLPQLQTVCVEYLAGNLKPETVCNVYEFAIVVGEETLIKECESVIQSKTTKVLKGASFLEVELDTVVRIFSLPTMNLENELVLVRAAELYDRTFRTTRTAKMFEKAMENSTKAAKAFTFGSLGLDQKTVPEKNETPQNATSSNSDSDLLKKTPIVQNGNDKQVDAELEIQASFKKINAALETTLSLSKYVTPPQAILGLRTPPQAGLSEYVIPHNLCSPTVGSRPALSNHDPSSAARPILRLLRQINFLTLTPQQIAEERAMRALLTTEELLAVVMNAASTNTFVPMPPGFSVNKTSRIKRDVTDVSIVLGNYQRPQKKAHRPYVDL